MARTNAQFTEVISSEVSFSNPLGLRRSMWVCLALGVGLLLGGSTQGATINVPASADTDIRANAQNNNWGAYPELWVGAAGHTTNYARRALFKFDLSMLPAGATITSASLQLTTVDGHTGNVNYSLYRAQKDWGEGTGTGKSGAAATTGQASWLNAKTGSVAWAAGGGLAGTDYSSTASATTSVGGFNTYTWTGANLLTDVKNWYANPSQNYGWFLISNSETANAGNVKHFASREYSILADRPALSITYTVPEPTSLVILGLGAMFIGRARRKRASENQIV